MFIPDSLQKLGPHVFDRCPMLVPSNIDVKDSNAVVAYLRWKLMPVARYYIMDDIEALKVALENGPEAPFKQTAKGVGFQLFFDKPIIVKTIIQTLPDATIDSQTPAAYAKEKNAPQLIIEMLELLTADEMKACDTESDIQAAVDEKKATRAKNKTAMAGIIDCTAREKATALQTKMFGELEAADVDAAQVTFEELKPFYGEQAKRLGNHIAVVMKKYKTTDAKRYKPFEEVKNIPMKEQTPPPSALSLEEQVKFQLAKATWYEEKFQAAMNEITLTPLTEVFRLDSNMEVMKAKFGPPKGFTCALAKMSENTPKTLRDLNCVTFEFEDPLLMALCFEVLNKKYNIYGLKNKYLQETFKEPPNLHMNLEIKEGWLCEVQMLFRDILLIKKELHKFYDVNRADGPFVVAGKLFKSLADPETKQPDGEDHKNDSNVNSESKINSLINSLIAKDAELSAKDSELEKKDEEIKRLTSQLSSTKPNTATPPPPPPEEGTYTYSQLLSNSLEGINTSKRETYLTDVEFTQVFGISKSDFEELPG
ncbi:hypothetical protein TL16_g11069 [Triparma laevis f. inornata]|uniref:HP domain-containing protein n=1 Tax=Triparma laevis f. inornata TaxID=1714386 RepID=A0A9W7BI80_9STRA|nr:hypothetical protein TL16_g11069 [Triparma laevis f. inornata]